jgi:SAM-dependent methyltransferase
VSETSATGSPEEWVIWHDLECGTYAADLPLWSELAAQAGGPVLDLGCGTGRVALHLASEQHQVLGVDREPTFVETLNERAAGAGVSARGEVGDVRELSLDRRFALAVAPMQLLQILAGEEERRACLGSIAAHLEPGAHAAVALVEDYDDAPDEGPPPLPDVREVGGWVYSSLPVSVRPAWEGIIITRLRQTVSPDGEMTEVQDEVHLSDLPAERLEEEAQAVGLTVAGRLRIPATEDHVGSTVVVLER